MIAEAVLVTSQTSPDTLSTVASTRGGSGPPELAQPAPLEPEDEPLELDEPEVDVEPPPLPAFVLPTLELLEPVLVLLAEVLDVLLAVVEKAPLEVEPEAVVAELEVLLDPDVEPVEPVEAGHKHVPNVPSGPQVWTPVGPPRHAQLAMPPWTQLAGPILPEEQPAAPAANTAEAAHLESRLMCPRLPNCEPGDPGLFRVSNQGHGGYHRGSHSKLRARCRGGRTC